MAAAPRCVTCVVIGAGERGTAYAQYATVFPDRLTVVAVCEPRPAFRAKMQTAHALKDTQCFESWTDLVTATGTHGKPLADFAIVATHDRAHRDPAVALAKLGCK